MTVRQFQHPVFSNQQQAEFLKMRDKEVLGKSLYFRKEAGKEFVRAPISVRAMK